MTSPSSLRDLYSHPSSAWSFLTPPSLPPNSTPSSSPYQWSTRLSHNPIFDLSPSLDLDPPSTINASHLLKSIAASAVLQYTSSVIAMPWEVGKLLLQVQWVPRNAGQPDSITELEQEAEEDDALSDSSNDDSYFADPNQITAVRHPATRPADDQGYVIRRSILEDGTRPDYVLPVGSADGVWGMIKRIGRFRAEGWLALWKGLLTSCITDVLSSSLQPLIHSLLQSLFFPTVSPSNQPPLLLPVASHLITGFLLSPLDLVRTRLIVQSFNPRYRTYSGPINALSQILRDEGGLKAIYLHPHLITPTIIDSSLRPLVSLALPGLLAGYIGANIAEDTNPVAWGFAELAGSCLGLLVTLPFETVRRRLQVQARGTAKPIKGCVELRPVPYNGVVDTFWHVLTEERSDLPVKSKGPRRRMSKATAKGMNEAQEGDRREEGEGEEEGWFKNTGIGQLYRGFGMRLGASVIVFLLVLFSGEESDGGWAEL